MTTEAQSFFTAADLTEDQLRAAKLTGATPENYAKALNARFGGEANKAYVDGLVSDLRANARTARQKSIDLIELTLSARMAL